MMALAIVNHWGEQFGVNMMISVNFCERHILVSSSRLLREIMTILMIPLKIIDLEVSNP